MHGTDDATGRDVLFKGTALSAPGVDAAYPGRYDCCGGARPGRHASQALGGLVGATLVAGYLGERLVRQRLRPSGWDPVESPLLLAAIGLAVAMAELGRRARRGTATT
jgi:hypothetical protein